MNRTTQLLVSLVPSNDEEAVVRRWANGDGQDRGQAEIKDNKAKALN